MPGDAITTIGCGGVGYLAALREAEPSADTLILIFWR